MPFSPWGGIPPPTPASKIRCLSLFSPASARSRNPFEFPQDPGGVLRPANGMNNVDPCSRAPTDASARQKKVSF